MALEQLARLGDAGTVPDCRGAFCLLARIATDMAASGLAERLVRRYGVGVIPGTSCGLRDGCYLRISYGGLGPDGVEEGMARLAHGPRDLTRT